MSIVLGRLASVKGKTCPDELVDVDELVADVEFEELKELEELDEVVELDELDDEDDISVALVDELVVLDSMDKLEDELVLVELAVPMAGYTTNATTRATTTTPKTAATTTLPTADRREPNRSRE